MKPKAFIAGPIQSMEEKQSYRDRISKILIQCGYEPVDPWRREKIVYTLKDWSVIKQNMDFVKRDLEDIEKCDVLIAYLPKLSAGACMELFYAKLRGKRTICICRLRNPSPWIIAHSDILIKRISDLKGVLEKIKLEFNGGSKSSRA
ncbi:MAG: nucleoside 2-deoxyribosyltransferase [Candidatus Bathyarchaeia archaeon]